MIYISRMNDTDNISTSVTVLTKYEAAIPTTPYLQNDGV